MSATLRSLNRQPRLDQRAIKDDTNPTLHALITEGKRLFDEAQTRVIAGEYRATASSVNAIRPLCIDLIEKLEELAKRDESTSVADRPPTGMYL